MMEMMRMMESSSLMANIKLVNMLLADSAREPVAANPTTKIPAMQITAMSRLKIIKRIASPINNTYIQ
jgi:hypothetical protein